MQFLLSLSLSILLGANAAAQGSILQQLDACNASGDATADARLAACTAVIDSGLASDHGVAIAYNSRGLARLKKQEFDRAIEDYSAAIQKDPEYASPYNNRGVAYEKKREYDRAIADFGAALKIDPQNANALANRASVHEKTGKLKDALNDLNKAIELQPGIGKLME